MDQNTAQQPSDQQSSSADNNYVDAYQPPPNNNAGMSPGQQSDQDQSNPANPGSTPPNPQPSEPGHSTPPQQPGVAQTQAPQPSVTAGTGEKSGQTTSESIEDQNIFFLLGVTDGTQEQRDAFLDELQQVIWEDFLEHDTKLLITTDEMTELQKLLENRESRDLEKQEEIIVFLEKLIPDLEEIMLEKALELKGDMVRERAQGLKQFFADKPDKLSRVDQAEKLMDEGKWYSAAHLMNSLNFS